VQISANARKMTTAEIVKFLFIALSLLLTRWHIPGITFTSFEVKNTADIHRKASRALR